MYKGDGGTSSVSISLNTINDVDDDRSKKEDGQQSRDYSQAETLPPPASSSIFTLGVDMQRQVDLRMNILRSPSRESVGTDISLFSVSTLASELTTRVKLLNVRAANERSRGPSPNFDSRHRSKRPEEIRELWFEDAYDLIKSMAALSSAVGLSKSFSTSDVADLPNTAADDEAAGGLLDASKRNAVSEPAFVTCQQSVYILQQNMRLQNASRSCSTWVAVGDASSTSQLPSPHAAAAAGAAAGSQPAIDSKPSPAAPSYSPADLVRSVNKKVRQHYIRRRLLNTYKALERLSQSEFNLDKLEVEVAAAAAAGGRGQHKARTSTLSAATECDGGGGADGRRSQRAKEAAGAPLGNAAAAANRLSVPGLNSVQTGGADARTGTLKRVHLPGVDPLTVMDVERGRGQPLTKYDRNMMIFNWLLTLEPEDDAAAPEMAAGAAYQ